MIVVAGIFSQCFQDKGLQQGLRHLADDHGLKTAEVVVSGVGSSLENAALTGCENRLLSQRR